MSTPLSNDQLAILKERAAYHVGATPTIEVRPKTLLALVECAEAAKALHDGCPDGTDQDDMWMVLGLALAKLEEL